MGCDTLSTMNRLIPHPRALRAHLRRGGLVAYATRAVFGLGCDPRSAQGLRRLLRLKRRPAHKGLIVIGDSLQRLQRFHAPLTELQRARVISSETGCTWLLPAGPRAWSLLTGHGRPRRMALRVETYVDALQLCRSLRMALVSTSANRAGQRPVKTTRECLRQFGGQVRVLPGRVVPRARPSTIIDVVSEAIIRK